MKNPHSWLVKESRHWVDRQIVSQQQAEQILSIYPEHQASRWGKMLISGFGAVMIGLGVILLFAYNWDEMSRFTKMALVLGVLAATHFAAFQARLKNRQALSESLFVLGTMLFGAGIWLVAQVYHLDEHYPNAFLLWGLGAMALAWALPSLPQAIMAVMLVMVWHMVEVFDFEFASHHALIILLLGIFPLIWILKSPLLARLASAAFFISVGLTTVTVDEHLLTSVLVLVASGVIFLSQATARQANPLLKHIGDELAKPAYLVFIIILFLLSFSEMSDDLLRVRFRGATEYIYFYFSLGFSQLLFAYLLFRRIFNPVVFAVELTVLLELYPSLLSIFYVVHAEAMIFNVLLLILSIGMIVEGSRKADARKMMWGSVILAALMFARYTDLFDSLISRAIVFLVVGAGLFVAGNIYNKNRQEKS